MSTSVCEAQLSSLGEESARSLCEVVGRINTNFDDISSAIAKLNTASTKLEKEVEATKQQEQALEQQLQKQLVPQVRQRLQNKLKEIKDQRQQQEKSLKDIQGKVVQYGQLQDMLETIRQSTEGLRRKVSSIPIEDNSGLGLGAVDAFMQPRAPTRAPTQRRTNTGYVPVRRRPGQVAPKRDVLGRILPKTRRTGLTRRPVRRRPVPRRPVTRRESGITPNVGEWKRQVAAQQQAAARIRKGL
jgi:outer membrane murein-binding lipoprotein Lpp